MVSIDAAPSASPGSMPHLKLLTLRLRNSRTRYGLRLYLSSANSPDSRMLMMPHSILVFLQHARNRSGEALSMCLVIVNVSRVASSCLAALRPDELLPPPPPPLLFCPPEPLCELARFF